MVQVLCGWMPKNLVNLTIKFLKNYNNRILSFYCLSMVDTIKLGMKEKCPLCHTLSQKFYEDTQRYCRCPECRVVFVIREDLLKQHEEVERYELHDSNTEDRGYRKFISPIVESITKDFQAFHKGLDFGAGTSAIISTVLGEKEYSIQNYDPYFHNYPQLLEAQYDYISSCEAIEHFYNPAKEFRHLREMLREDGKLYLMTDIYDERDFGSWYYKNDPTHVTLYTKETFSWIQEHYDFKELSIEKRLIVFTS